MDDFLFYSALGCLLAGVILAACHKTPGCEGDCSQGDKTCDCQK